MRKKNTLIEIFNLINKSINRTKKTIINFFFSFFFQGHISLKNQVFYIFIMPIKPLNIGKKDGFIYKINNCLYIKVEIKFYLYIYLIYYYENILYMITSLFKDSHYKRLERTINLRNYRVSVTNSNDSISHKDYTFKVFFFSFIYTKKNK